MSLRAKALSGGLWAAIQQLSQIGLQFVVGIVLARLLEPRDYGLFAMVGVFLMFLQIPMEGGFGMALVQRKKLKDDDISTVFWFNLAASLACYGIVWFGAPLLAAFYREPQLIALVRAGGIGLLIGAFGVCQRAMLERAMAFRKVALIQLPAFAASAALAIVLAYRGAGTWSLVAMSLSSALFSSGALWWHSSWRPTRTFDRVAFRELFRFGANTAGERLSNAIYSNLVTLVIGRVFSLVDVGFYNRARHFQQLPGNTIHSIFNRVLLPLLSQVQDAPQKRKLAFLHSVRLASLISCPVFMGMAAVATPMIETLIGSKWLPAALYLQILCIPAVLLPLHAINVNAILSQGESGLSLRLNLLKQGIQLVIIAVTYRFGIVVMLSAQAVAAFLFFFINAWPNRRLMTVSLREQLGAFLPYFAVAAGMGGAVILLLHAIVWPAAVELVLGGVAGSVLYVIGIRLLRLPAHVELGRLCEGLPRIGRMFRVVLG